MKTDQLVLIALTILVIFIFQFNGITNLNANNPDNNQSDIVNNTQNQTENNTQKNESHQNISTPRVYNIEIRNFAFQPKELTIKRGDTIIWTNKDSVRHTVTSYSSNELGSQLLSMNQQYSHTFTQSGVYEYYCTPHSYMDGRINVE